MLKGAYSGEVKYDVGDVVVYTDNVVYHLQHPCKAGIPPKDTLYRSRVSQRTEEAVLLIMDAISLLNGEIEAVQESIPTNVSDDAVVLKSSTPDSEKEFIITVDDDGELTATELGGE